MITFGVLAQERPQGAGKGHADRLMHLDLFDPRQVVFDRVLDGEDLAPLGIQMR
jgi:hypothetical protein